jgi:peptidyl-prolyl cis-trans isomerase B (cyclophilin B)
MTKLAKSMLSCIMLLCLINGSAFAEQNSTTTNKNTMVTLKTNFGDIEIELNADKAPKTVENFLQYVKEGHYDGVIFHRVINNFMVQGGGFDADMKEKKSRGPIPNEASNGLKNEKYTLAMARTSEPHSASAQFFINTKDNEFLNFSSETQNGWGYAVFGKVVGGTEIVDKIEAVQTGQSGSHGDVPVEPVIIESASIAE